MADERYVGIDLGTTGIKAGLFDAAGNVLAAAAREIQLDTPAPGFAEFDADEYIRLVFEAIREVAGGSGGVRAIGLSSQAQTFVLLDEAGRPVRPAVSWLDVRAEAEAKELSDLAHRLGGEPITAIASCPKILWLRRREPETMARVRQVHVIPDHLIYRLTGRAATDPVTAWSTGACARWTRAWAGEILAACGLAPEMMPEIRLPGEPAGTLTRDAARELGLPEGVIAVVGTNDQYAGALGAGNVAPGCASLALGTALAIVATARDVTGQSQVGNRGTATRFASVETGWQSRISRPPFETASLARGGLARDDAPAGAMIAPHPAATNENPLRALLAYAKTSGVVLRWLRDLVAPGLSYEQLFAEAGSAPVGAGGLTCLPHFSGTATPDFNPAARGAFAGLTLAHGRAHLVRALVESLAFTVRENLEWLSGSVTVRELRAIGGGAKSDLWLQMIADVTGVAVERPETSEAACLGAAELAMTGAGRFKSVAEAARALYRPGRRFVPNPALRAEYDAAFARYRGLYEALYRARQSSVISDQSSVTSYQ